MGSKDAVRLLQSTPNELALAFLNRYEADGEDFWNKIVTWGQLETFETKEKSKQWMDSNLPNK